MKVLTKSGKKELKFDHLAIWNLKKETGRELFDLIQDIDAENTKDVKITTMYQLLYAAFGEQYDNIEEMLSDLKETEFNNYIEAIGTSVGKLFGENTTDNSENEK